MRSSKGTCAVVPSARVMINVTSCCGFNTPSMPVILKLSSPSKPKLATKVPVTIRHAEGTAKTEVDQRKETTPFPFVAVGEYRFKAGDAGFVELRNGDALDGRVVVDGVRWVWLGE